MNAILGIGIMVAITAAAGVFMWYFFAAFAIVGMDVEVDGVLLTQHNYADKLDAVCSMDIKTLDEWLYGLELDRDERERLRLDVYMACGSPNELENGR